MIQQRAIKDFYSGAEAGELHGDERLEIPPADQAGQMLVVAGSRPMRLEAEPTRVAVMGQRRDLAAPIDPAFAHWSPDWLVPVHVAILDMHVDDARNRQFPVP